ncbi:MAG: hypothetical protein ACFE0J_14665 [Elainellaceae cyanobacterium]
MHLRLEWLTRQFAGIEQRWLVVESEARKASDLTHLVKQITEQQKQRFVPNLFQSIRALIVLD